MLRSYLSYFITINPQKCHQFLYYSVEYSRSYWLSTRKQIPEPWPLGLHALQKNPIRVD